MSKGPVFVFSSQGGQWPCMGQKLYAQEPAFREAIRRADVEVMKNLGWSLDAEFVRDVHGYRLNSDGPSIQPAVTALQSALAAVFHERGIEPAAVTGLSMGEVAATLQAEVLTLPDSFKVVASQSRMAEGESGRGRMVFVRASSSDVEAMIRPFGDAIDVAAELSPLMTTVAGEEASLRALKESLVGSGVACGFVNVGFAFHTAKVKGMEKDFLQLLTGLAPGDGGVPVYSSVTGELRRGADFDATYWWRIMSERARFVATVTSLLRDGYRTFVEFGPHPTLSDSISETASSLGVQVLVLPTMKRTEDERVTLRSTLETLERIGAGDEGSTSDSRTTGAGSAESTAKAEFDPFAPEVRRDPYPFYRQLRGTPVCRVARLGSYAVSRYDDVLFVLENPQLFSSSVMMRADSTLLGADGSAHARARPIVNRAFSLSETAGLEDRLRLDAPLVVSKLVSRGEFDLVSDFANRLPMLAIAEILGIRDKGYVNFKRWSRAVVSASSSDPRIPADPETSMRIREFDDFFRSAIAERALSPRDDPIGKLLHSNGGADVLTQEQALSICKLLLIAGNETTTNLIGNAIIALLRHPEELIRVSADRGLIPGLIEETARYDSPVQIILRRATDAVEVSGETIPKGAQVMAIVGSANRDERAFNDPDRFDVGRDARDHLGFGYGPHSCLGASLARLEARIALEALHPWLMRLRPVQSLERIEYLDSLNLRGAKSLRLTVAS